MRSRSAICIAVVVALLVIPVAQAKGPKPVQTLDGEILVGDPNCYSPSTNRRIVLLVGEEADGINGYDFDVSKKTWGGRFVLEVTGGTAITEHDLVISFFRAYGEPTEDSPFIFYDTKLGGEAGKVPPDATKAIVSLCQGPNAHGTDPPVTLGLQTAFTYSAWAPKKRP